MKIVSTLALAASLLAGAAVADPAFAQKKGAEQAAAQPGAAPQRKFEFSKEARPTLGALQSELGPP